jgi:DNA modification methylase
MVAPAMLTIGGWYGMMWGMIHHGDALTVLRTMPDNSVNCVVTSPPYFGLRDYGTGEWEGGDPGCDHTQGRNGSGRADGIIDERGQRNWEYQDPVTTVDLLAREILDLREIVGRGA